MTEKVKEKYKDKLQQALAECETGKQANLICEVVNVLIDYITGNEWQTGEPKEKGYYLVTNGENKPDIRKWDNGWYHDMYRRYTDKELEIIAWKKIEPYEHERKE